MKTIDKSKVLVGSDFEMFLQNSEGKIISAIPFNSGTKENPEKIEGYPGCCIQRDGILQECNVPPVRLDESDNFIENIKLVKEYIYNKFAHKYDLKLVCCPTACLEEDQLKHDEARQIGCSADYNAWKDGEVNEKPSYDDSGLRCCGMHFHLSYPDADVDTSIDLMKLFDLFLTVPFVLLDKDKDRRKLYGKAGSFRLCNWGEVGGFEARTLSNYVLSDYELIEYVFNQLNEMFNYYNTHSMDEVNEVADDIIKAINESNEELAGIICEKFGILLLLPELY
jgi:hypothetical protein